MLRYIYHILLLAISAITLVGCNITNDNYLVGVSQFSDESRFKEMNRQILREAKIYDCYDIVYSSAGDDVQKQIKDIEEYISADVDAIILTSHYPSELATVLSRAMEEGIRVIVADHDADSLQRTAFIGVKDRYIGILAGRYYKDKIGANNRILELRNSLDPERAEVVHEAFITHLSHLAKFATSVEVPSQKAIDTKAMDSLLRSHPDINLFFAHTNNIGRAVYLAAQRLGRQDKIDICGVGYNTSEVVESVSSLTLNASILYPSVGATAMQTLNAVFVGDEFKSDCRLFPTLIDISNVSLLKNQYWTEYRLDGEIFSMSNRITNHKRSMAQQRFTSIIVLLLAIILTASVTYIMRRRTKALHEQVKFLLSLRIESNPITEAAQSDEATKRISPQDQKFIARLREIIEENIGDPNFGVEQMSDKLNYSVAQAYRKIKMLTGESPNQILRSARVKMGDHLLHNSDKSIADISDEIGFGAPSSFSKYYKQTYGVSPSKVVR